MKEVMTITQAAKLLNVSEETIRRWANSGNLPGIDILPGSSVASPTTTIPAKTPEPTPVYTANLALRTSRIASHIAANNAQPAITSDAVSENAPTPETFTEPSPLHTGNINESIARARTDSLGEEIAQPLTPSSPSSDTPQPLSNPNELATDSDEPSPAMIDEFLHCITLLNDAAIALQAMINASLMTHDYMEVLDALSCDLIVLNPNH